MWKRDLESTQDLDCSGNKSQTSVGIKPLASVRTAIGRPVGFAKRSSCMAVLTAVTCYPCTWGVGGGCWGCA